MEGLFILGFVGLIIFLILYYVGALPGSERWCDKCNTWNIMKWTSSVPGDYYTCSKCGQKNMKNRGCPHCGWYGRYENRYVGRVGPYSEMINFGSYLQVFRETWSCPHHGNYLCVVPASESRDYSAYDDSNNDQDDYDYSYHQEEEDHSYNDFDRR